LTLSYQTWYDIESDYDYVYLTASEDGQTWDIVKTPRGTDLDPSGNSYGWGYNGESGNWVFRKRLIYLNSPASKCNCASNTLPMRQSMAKACLLDDISIPEIDYFTDFEMDDGGWEADGFVRIQNRLPQTYRLSLIDLGRPKTVQTIVVSAGESIELTLDTDDIVLVVSGTTRFTRQPAGYSFSLE
jgi:immune inhibitor A